MLGDRYFRKPALWALAALLAMFLAAGSAKAGDLTKIDSSLKLVPADAAFYGSYMRNAEQVAIAGKSNAWKKLMSLPVIQLGKMMYGMQAGDPNSPAGKFRAAMSDPEVVKLIDLAADMTSQEVFFLGDKEWGGSLVAMQKLNTQFQRLAQKMQKGSRGGAPESGAAELIKQMARENLEIPGPSLIIGFRLKDQDAAKAQLRRLETVWRETIEEQTPVLARALKWEKVAGNEFLTLRLDGSMLPWETMPLDEFDGDAEVKTAIEKVIATVKKMKLVVAIGLRDDYLLLSIGPSTKLVERLGKGELLVNSPTLKPLAEHADKQLVSIGYVSKALMRQAQNPAAQVESLRVMAEQAMEATEVDEQDQRKLLADIDTLTKKLAEGLGEPGAQLAFSFLVGAGYEGYHHDWSSHPELDGSKPLTILNHLGGTPIMALVNRGKADVAQYDQMIDWTRTCFGHVKEIVLPKMPDEERAKAEKFLTTATPLLERCHRATRDLLLPAMADGQIALVLDAKLKSKRFCQHMAELPREMPMIEPAIVCGVSKPKEVVQAFSEYREVINGLIDALRSAGAEIPAEIKLPKPVVEKAANGSLYRFVLPQDWGIEKRLFPHFALGKQIGIAGVSQEQSQRMLKAEPLTSGGVLADLGKPRASAAVFNVAELLAAIKPWVDYGFDVAIQENNGSMAINAAAAQVDTVFEILQIFRTVTSESYFADKALVTHWMTEIRDLPAEADESK